MGRTRSARALKLFYTLAGERLTGVKQACAGGNIWAGFFEPSERGRRDEAHGSRKARGGVLERTLGCGGLFRRRQRGGNFFSWVDGRACVRRCRDHTLSLISAPLSVSYTFTMLVRLLK